MKANYKAIHNNSLCRRCGTQEEKIEHLWDCPEFSNECTTKNCYMDKNDAKTLIKINRDVEKFLDYAYLYPPVLSAKIVGNCSEMGTCLHFYFYFY